MQHVCLLRCHQLSLSDYRNGNFSLQVIDAASLAVLALAVLALTVLALTLVALTVLLLSVLALTADTLSGTSCFAWPFHSVLDLCIISLCQM